MKNILIIISIICLLYSCKKEGEVSPVQTDSTDKISFLQPSNFPSPIYTYSNNPLSKKGFELGRFLFYDPILSLDSSISCGTCHAQGHAFADHNIP